ncbi:hypothetical protein BX666DRAFT_1847734 [Dichotomocladium elegans]|nr:hypothetical protein BX666DRAFT_1847734 [Dichotomocladium elegans]
MSTVFLLYEGGCGNEVEEDCGSKIMDYIVDQNEFIVETIATRSGYLQSQQNKHKTGFYLL